MSKKDIPEWNAAIMLAGNITLSLIMVINLFSWDDIINMQIEKQRLDFGLAELVVALLLSLFLLNCFLFIKGGKYKQYIIEFEGQSKADRRLSKYLGVILYFGGYIFPITYIILNVEIIE
ncbi:hypothetical protein H8S95_14080 [Pontibacter sp. KCTC 32443]|uniref:hypothetical protein n=1 Tax=Pontibacter TaxID=323449 RepID=UPI00164EBDD5|nr:MULTISPECIES: hypothetical protein [Pontibacter]MBC5775203.1 hypothetical protein [Pontibacter sp. KCTC 32443]